MSTDGTFVEVNPAWTAITGYPEEELLGRSFVEITHPDDVEADLDHVRRVLQGERDSYRMQKRYLHRSGQVLWVDLWVAVVSDEHDRPRHFVAQILEIEEPAAL